MKIFKNNQGLEKIAAVLLTILAGIIIIAGLTYAYRASLFNKSAVLPDRVAENQAKGQLIGGDKDAGGCLVGAGYSWCELKQKCLRVWEEACVDEDTQKLVEDYINAHISELSPQKEVLGGKFYTTRIIFPSENEAIIDYEDGHIALSASAQFKIINNKVMIQNFTVTNDNGASAETAHNDSIGVVELTKLFSAKYNIKPENIVVNITNDQGLYLRGGVKFSKDENAPGGLFLAKIVDGAYQIVYDGNGMIDCALVSDFPADMITDCANQE